MRVTIGLTLILVGMVVGLTAPVAYNGQWLIGFILAITGTVLCAPWKMEDPNA